MRHSYLIRYGLMRRVGQFLSESDGFERGQKVVIRSHRGTELGEVLLEVPHASEPIPAVGSATVIRAADAVDLERAQRIDLERSRRFALCEQVFLDGVWPIELVDVEPLLDDRRTVLHYLGPHALDDAGLRSLFHERCGLDVLLEPVGRDVSDELDDSSDHAEEAHSCGDCGSGGGCGSGGCSTSGDSLGGCSDCGVKKLLSSRRVGAAQ